MPHARLTQLTYTVAGPDETELIHEARTRLVKTVTTPEEWTIAITAEPTSGFPGQDWLGTAVATHTPPPKKPA